MDSDNNPIVSTSSDTVHMRNISPMECESDTDINQASQGDSTDSLVLVNKTREETRSDSSIPSSSSSFQNPLNTLNADTCTVNRNQPINTTDDNSTKDSTMPDESTCRNSLKTDNSPANNQPTFTGTESEMVCETHSTNESEKPKPSDYCNNDTVNEKMNCGQKIPDTQNETLHGKEPVSNLNPSPSHNQTQNYQDPITQSKPVLDGARSIINPVDCNRQYMGHGNEPFSNDMGPHSSFNHRQEPLQNQTQNYQDPITERKSGFYGADHEDLSRFQKPIQSSTSPVRHNRQYALSPDLGTVQLSTTKGMIYNSSTGSKETQQYVCSPPHSIPPNPPSYKIPNPNLESWPFGTNAMPPYSVYDPPVARPEIYLPPGNYPMHMLPQVPNYSMGPIGIQPRFIPQYDFHSYQGQLAAGAQIFQTEQLEHQNLQGGPRSLFNPQAGIPLNIYKFTGGHPNYHSTNTRESQFDAQRNIPSSLRQTNAMVEKNGSFSYGDTTNINQKNENPKILNSREEEVYPVSSDLKRDTVTSGSTNSRPVIERTIDHSDKDSEVPPVHNDQRNGARRNSLNVKEVLETKENKISDHPIGKDQTKSVLIESTTEQPELQMLKLALSNKKKDGGPIETLKYNSIKKQYLVTFEHSRDALQIVNTNFTVSGVPLKLSLYWEDPENFDKEQIKQKPQTLEIKVKSSDILRVKHILQNEKILSRFYRRLKLKCECKSVKHQDSNDYIIIFEVMEFVEDLEGSSKNAAEILKSIGDDLVQTIIPVPDGINLKLQIKELDKESKDVSLTYSGQKMYVVSKSEKIASDYEKKIQNMIKELQDEMKRKNEEIQKIALVPVEKKFFQRFLLQSEELKHYNVLLGIVEDGVTIKGQSSNITEAKLFIHEILAKTSSQKIYNVNSSEYLFLKESNYIDKIESKIRERKLKVCIGVKRDELVIISSERNDLPEAETIVKESILSQSLPIETTQFLQSNKWQTLVSNIKEEHHSEVMIQTNVKSCKMTIVGVTSIVKRVSGQIEDYLESITETNDVVFADIMKMDYIRRYGYNKILEIQKICNLTIICDPLPLQLKGTKTAVERGKSSVISIIESIKTDTLVMKFIGIGTLFTQKRGSEIVSRIGEESNCLIIEEKKRLITGTSEKPLRQWTLANDKKIEVMKTDMRYLDCDAIVNAANSHLKHGSGLAGAIVDVVSQQKIYPFPGGHEIQKECNKYVNTKGKVEVGEVMVGISGKLPCKKIIHAVGPVWHKGTRNEASLLANAICNSLKAADKNNLSSIAIPAISTGIFGYPMAEACKIIVKTIVNYLMKSKSIITHVLLCDIKEDSLAAFIRNLSSELGEQNGMKENVREDSLGAVGGVSDSAHSDTDEPSDAEDKESNPDSGDDVEENLQTSGETDNDSVRSKMKVKSGKITTQQVDVIVNCTSGELHLKSGALSRAILEAAGSSIQSECDEKYSGGISPGAIAVTTGGKLPCKKIYHACIQSYTKDKSQARKSLEVSISRSLENATKSGFKSIAFPALGCGRLGFSADVSASVVFKTIEEFLKNKPETSLKEVIFIIHPKDTSVLKAYTEIGKDFNVGLVTVTKTSNENGKISYGKIDVEICQGDLTKESTDCIVNVCTTSMELKYGISKLISEKGGSKIAEECSARKYEIKKDGILITVSGKLPCSAICHLLIQKSSEDWTSIIKNALYKMNKDGFSSISLPAIGTGGLKVNPKTSAEFIMSALKSYGEKVKSPNLTKVRIVIYQKEHVQEFLKVFGVGYKKYHSASSSKGRELKKNNKKHRKAMNEIQLTIYSDSLTNIEEAKKKLQERLSDEMETKKIPQYLQDIIEKLNSNQKEELKDIAESFYVKLKFDKSRKEISLNGLTKQVRDCCDQIVDRLQGWKSSDQKSSEKAILSKYVDWVYEEKSGERTHSFGPGISAKLEKAKIEKLEEIEISDHKGRKYKVNFKEMKEYPKHGSPVKIYRIEKGGTRSSKLLKGEREALSGNKTVYFDLQPTRNYDDSKPEENHFRLAESQFCRLLNNSAQYSVTKVEYVVNPVLNKRFRAAQQELKGSLGEKNSLPVLAFHGTNVTNIQSICENGFKKQGDSGFAQSHGAKYGQGVYFSEYPDYSIRYINGATKLLLCQVLIGKSYTCTGLRGNNSQVEAGYDSHISSDMKELVIFKTERILPCYIVHYTPKSGDYQYK